MEPKVIRKALCAALLAALVLPAVLKAQELTLGQCFGLAEKKNETLMIQGARQFQAGERVKEYLGRILPAISYNYTKTYRDTNDGQYTTDLNDSKFTASQPLFHGLADIYAYKQAKNQAMTEAYNYEFALLALRSQVTAAFYSLVQVDADILNLKNNEQLLVDRMAELKERVRLGKSRESEILMVESQIAGLKAQEENDQGSRAAILETLAYLTGMGSESITVKDGTPAVSAVEPLDNFISSGKNRPEVKAASNDLRSQKYALNIAKGAHLPTLDLSADCFTHQSGSFSNSDWDALLVLNFPLFQGGAAVSKVREEDSRLKEYEDRLSLVSRETESQIRGFYQQAVSAVKQAAAYQDAYDKAEKSYQMQLKDYRYGLVNNLDVLQALSVMLDARRSLDKALVQAKINKALLDIAAVKN